MKNLFMAMVLAVTMVGCTSTFTKEKLKWNAVQLDSFVTLMDAEKTTRDNEQKLIRAMRVWTWAMNQNENGVDLPADVELILKGSQ